jgi:GNAT superfamily N-acetyltransferase
MASALGLPLKVGDMWLDPDRLGLIATIWRAVHSVDPGLIHRAVPGKKDWLDALAPSFTEPVLILRSRSVDDVHPFPKLLGTIGARGRTFPPGMNYIGSRTPENPDAPHVFSVVWAAPNGLVKGLASVHLRASPETSKASGKIGDVCIGVHPKHRRGGLATALLDRLLTLYPVNFSQQLCMEDGAAFLRSYLTRRGIAFIDRYQTPEEYADRAMSTGPKDERPEVLEVMRRLLVEFARARATHTSAEFLAFCHGEMAPQVASVRSETV